MFDSVDADRVYWDTFAAELSDVSRSAPWNRSKRPCIYCGALTRALSQVCCAHSDLRSLDPHTNILAGRFQQSALKETLVPDSPPVSAAASVSSSASVTEPDAVPVHGFTPGVAWTDGGPREEGLPSGTAALTMLDGGE